MTQLINSWHLLNDGVPCLSLVVVVAAQGGEVLVSIPVCPLLLFSAIYTTALSAGQENTFGRFWSVQHSGAGLLQKLIVAKEMGVEVRDRLRRSAIEASSISASYLLPDASDV
uniref:ABC transmembrane type-1 domain-containing protein n=1 Tax=Heterorhabditis bacteriophora TaxID=37862 RepID=A0A1I7WCF7_HETBA